MVMNTPIKTVVRDGFGSCHGCGEPLRSIALLDIFRMSMETMTAIFATTEDNPNCAMTFSGSSLVLEAEEALARAEEANERNDSEKAILEYTHAINAINYLASASSGAHLILRAHDILLQAHAYRAELEGDSELFEGVRAAYPKASVRTPRDEPTWYLSKSAYRSLFYMLPARCMAGAPDDGPRFAYLDLRNDSRQAAFHHPDFLAQLELAGGSPPELHHSMISAHPHCDGRDIIFERLGGTWKGLYSLHITKIPSFPSPFPFGDGQVHVWDLKQFVHVFPTACQAREYSRILFENKKNRRRTWSNAFTPLSRKFQAAEEDRKGLGYSRLEQGICPCWQNRHTSDSERIPFDSCDGRERFYQAVYSVRGRSPWWYCAGGQGPRLPGAASCREPVGQCILCFGRMASPGSHLVRLLWEKSNGAEGLYAM